MLGALCQHQRKTACPNRRNDLRADHFVPSAILGQSLVKLLELDASIRVHPIPARGIGRLNFRSPEARGPNQHMVNERPQGGLVARIHSVTNWPALHEDDRVVAVLASYGSGQAREVTGLR